MRALMLAFVAACTSPALADDTIPARLAGVWGTAESLFSGSTEQMEIHLQPDGFGLLAGSSPPSTIISGPDKGKPGPRVAMGVPFRATLDGTAMTVAPFNPGNWQDKGPALICRYEAPDNTLHCTVDDKKTFIMKRRSASLDPQTIAGIEEMKIALRAYAGKASAIRPGGAK